ncbi:hypothetical protein VPHK449_0057 [Vibrio phage K449]
MVTVLYPLTKLAKSYKTSPKLLSILALSCQN